MNDFGLFIESISKNIDNIYIIVPLIFVGISYKFIEILSSGKIYKIKILKADTNLNIVEKLITDKNITLSAYQKRICDEIITESLINILTGFRLRSGEKTIYDQALSLTGKTYLSFFSAKIKLPSETIEKSSLAYLWPSLFYIVVSIIMIILDSLFIGYILSKGDSEVYIILLVLSIIAMIFISALYIVSFNRVSNSLLLYWYCRRNKSLGSIK
ncbi:hypothetical protein [Acidithiobacillus sp.]